MTKIFMLDNLDSFTYNLVDEFQCLGFDPIVYRNTIKADFILAQMAKAQQQTPDEQLLLVLSPGPGDPSHAGCLMELISKAQGKYPMLGICLGHQALIQHYGGIIGRAPEIVHGKSSPIEHCASGAFEGITNPLPVARYHSLVATKMPNSLDTIAYFTTDKNEQLTMAIEHKDDAVLGFQFHPESILTTYGSNLLAQSIHYLLSLTNSSFKGEDQGVTHD